MDLGPEVLLNLKAYLAFALIAALGIVALQFFAGRWLPVPRLRRGRWSGGEVLFCFVLFPIIQYLLVVGLDETGFFFFLFDEHVSGLRQVLVAAPLILPLLFAVFFTLLYQISRTRPAHVGLTTARWPANVRLGLAAFCVTTPVVLGLNYLVRLMTPRLPQAFEALVKEPLFPLEWWLLAFNAILVAPLLEEWLFRGLLQGWLRRASPLGHLVIALLALLEGSRPLFESIADEDKPGDPILWESLAFAFVVVGIYVAGVLRIWWPVFEKGMHVFHEGAPSDRADAPVIAEPVEGQTPLLLPEGPRWEAFKRANAQWAIVGSAMLFAMMHEAWPSAVALLPLGLVLGWLAHRTQSLIPCIVLHMLFNAVAFTVLYFSAPATPNGNEVTTALRPAAMGSTVSSAPGSWWPRLR